MALSFAGSSTNRVNVGSNAVLDNPTVGTVCGWFRLTSAGGRYLLCKADSTFANYLLFYVNSGRSMVMAKSKSTSIYEFRSGTGIISDNIDYFGAWSFNFTSGVNGDQIFYLGTKTSVATSQSQSLQNHGSGTLWDDSAESMHIANAGNSGAYNSGGAPAVISHISAVFGRQLTLEEIIQQQFARMPVTNTAGFWEVGWPGTTVPDLSGNGGDGTVTGASAADHVALPRVLYHLEDFSGEYIAAVTTNNYTLTAATASFALTGNNANLHPSNATLTASSATFTLTGNAANLAHGTGTLTAQTGIFTFTGNNASLGYNAVIVDQGVSYQTLNGWEATAEAAQEYNVPNDPDVYEYPSTTFANYKDGILNAMDDAGINALRLEILFSDWNATGYTVVTPAPYAAVQPTTSSTGQRHFDRLTHTMDAFVTEYRDRLAARGESLHLTICIVDFNTAGYSAENSPTEYSFFVVKTIEAFYNAYGFLPDVLEAILEPDNAPNTTNWTAAKLADNIVQANTDLVAAGYTGIRWRAPSVMSVANAATWYADMKTANASVTALLDELPYHRYGGTNTDVATFQSAAAADGNTTAMLEYISADANTLYDDLTIGLNSSWQQYTITFPYSGSSGSGGQYIYVNETTWAVSLNARTKFLRQYFRYIRRGAVMKGVTNKSSAALGVPFANANGTYIVPIKCSVASNFDVIGLPAGTYCIRYTTGTVSSAPSAYDTALTTQTISTGGAVRVAMPAAGIVTVFDGSYRPAMPTGTATFALTGNAATLTHGTTNAYTLTATTATFTLTGNATALTAQRLLTATTRTYSLTGIDAALTYSPVGSFTLSAQKGTFTLTGNAAGLTAQRAIALTKGTFTETGNAAGIYYGRTFAAGTASFSLTGNAAGLRAGRYIAPTVASFVLTGKLVTLNYSAAPSSKLDLTVSDTSAYLITVLDASATNISISDAAATNMSVTDAATTNLTVGDSTR